MNEAKKILEKTHYGLDVFKFYLGDGCTAKTFRNTSREDKVASCHLYLNQSHDGSRYYFMQDYGDSSFCGNCFSVVARLLGYNVRTEYKHLLQQIDQDLNLGVFDEERNFFVRKKVVTPKVVGAGSHVCASRVKDFIPVVKSFTAGELEYWGRYGITQSVLEQYGVVSIESCQFIKENGKRYSIVSSSLAPTFAYMFNGGRGYKFYRPNSNCRFLYAGQLPKPYVFGWNNLPLEGESVFITGGEKDVLSLVSYGFPAIAFNSETARIPEDKMKELSEKFKGVVFLYDCDETGKNESRKQVELYADKYPVKRLVLPLAGTKKEKDISDFFSLGKNRQDLLDIIKEIR